MPQPDDPAPKPQRGRPRDPERSRRILEAAQRHFYEHGLERSSLDPIAADAGVSKMTVYSNFGSKEGLFQAVVRDRTETVVGGLAGAEELDPNQPQKALLAIGGRFLALAREDGALGKFRSVYGVAGLSRRPAWRSTRRVRRDWTASWPAICAVPTRRAR